MQNNDYDVEYISIVKDILDNKDFDKTKHIDHHGITRFNHLVKISYNSYKIAKTLKLDYHAVARAGLLHDFYPTEVNRNRKEWFTSTFNHAKKAEEYSSNIFKLNEKEKDIIASHMFPYAIRPTLPKYAESWVVNIVDKIVGSYELLKKFKFKLSYALNLYILFLLNSIK